MRVQEEQIRMAAFKWLEKQTEYDDVLSWTTLQQGFVYKGFRVTLVGPQGIWKPRVFSTVPLSITTSPNSPYGDSVTDDGFLIYKYRGTDLLHRDNVGLRQAMVDKIPLIYFHGILTGKYLAVWPVFIIEDNPSLLSFVVAIDDKKAIGLREQHDGLAVWERVSEGPDYYRRQYITSTFRSRLHQRSFRERVLDAYRTQCAFCRLKHAELLDAAHIIPDSHDDGVPIVSNGLSLCKIHHAAFDRHFIGVNPDYKIIVRDDLLQEVDGPMLRHGIQEIHNRNLILPQDKNQWPDKDRLAARFDVFKNAI